MSRIRFSIREILLLVLAMGVAFGWWVDHDSLRRELVVSHVSAESYEMRLKAIPDEVDSLDDPEAARLLIYALSDPHPRVASAAEQSLRRLSGIDRGFGSIENTTPDERLAIMGRWIDWYLSQK